MKKTLAILFSMCFIGVQYAQKGKSFPVIGGVSLDGKNVELPPKNNKYSVIGIAYNRAAEKELKDWLNPMYSLFVKKDKGGAFDVAEIYDVNFYFIPMISGFKKAAEDFKNGTDKEFWPYILDASTDVKLLKTNLNVINEKEPYFYIVDTNGKIVEFESGKYSEEKMDKLEEAVE